jgi:2'-5' RNA ligase
VENRESQWRLFVALPVPERVRSTLTDVQRELRPLLKEGEASWPRTGHFHLTLRFLGNVDSRRIEELETCLRPLAAAHEQMVLHCERLGCFPALRRPKVIWAWVHDEGNRLMVLQRAIENAAAAFTRQPEEAKFVGHVTLARVKRCQRMTSERIAAFVEGAVERRFGSWTAEAMELIRSEMSAGGSHYTTLAALPLKRKP